MSTASYFKTLGQIEDQVTARMTELRQAEKDASIYCDGMAFDANSAAEVYRAALDHIGVSRRDTAGMNATALRVLLKSVRTSQASRGAPAMAYDSASQGPSVLDSILAGVRHPRDLSTRNDFRR
jgi:hypothetical protein